MPGDGRLEQGRGGGVQDPGQGLGPPGHQGHGQAPPGQGVRGLEPHGAGPHHHDPAGWRQTGRQALPVGQGAQGVDAGELLPLKAQKAGPGPGGDEQAVIGDDPPAQEVHGVGAGVHPHHRLPQDRAQGSTPGNSPRP